MSRLTQEQIDGIKQFAKGKRTDNLNNFLRKLKYHRPITDYEKQPDWPKDPWKYLPERFAKQTAVAAGCTAEDRDKPGTVRNKLIAWAQKGSDAQEMIQRVFDASVSIMVLRETLGTEPDDAPTRDAGHKAVYGPSKADELGLSDITLREVEDALAD